MWWEQSKRGEGRRDSTGKAISGASGGGGEARQAAATGSTLLYKMRGGAGHMDRGHAPHPAAIFSVQHMNGGS